MKKNDFESFPLYLGALTWNHPYTTREEIMLSILWQSNVHCILKGLVMVILGNSLNLRIKADSATSSALIFN